MAELPHRCHGNDPQRRASMLPQQVTSGGFCAAERESEHEKPEKRQRQANKNAAALLKRVRIHPEAKRILGNSLIPVVSLERLNFQSVSLMSLQPVVSLVRLPCQHQAELHNDFFSSDRPQQNGFSKDEEDVLEIRGDSPPSQPEESSSEQSEPKPISWTEPYCPEDAFPSEEPEQDSGFDCESNPEQPFILFDSGCDEWDLDGKSDSETFYLDPDPEPILVIHLDPEPEADQEQDQSLQLEDELESKCESDVVEMDDGADHTPDVGDPSMQQPEPGAGLAEPESEDFCAVCLNGGDLLCCDRCPKVFHVDCHVPALVSFPLGDWACTLCRSDQEPPEAYACEDAPSRGAVRTPYTLSSRDQRRCEKLSLLLYCHPLSPPFHEPVSPLARNYYQIIKRPIDLSLIRRKLDHSNTLHYFSSEQFVDDVLLMLKNCATFNYPDSEVAQAGRSLEVFFLSKLKEVFPERTFPSASQDPTDRARLRWLCGKRKDSYRKKKYAFSGKKYYL